MGLVSPSIVPSSPSLWDLLFIKPGLARKCLFVFIHAYQPAKACWDADMAHVIGGTGAVPNRFQQLTKDTEPVTDPPFTSKGKGIIWELVNETVTDFPAFPEIPPWDCKMSVDVLSPAGYIDQYVPPDLKTYAI